MLRYRLYFERDCVDVLITITDVGATVETRYAGHSSGVHPFLSVEAAERAVEKYGFVPVSEALLGN